MLSWAYAREKVHMARLPGLDGMSGFAPRGWAKASNSERIGAAVGSSMNLGFEAPADAYAVMAAVDAQGRAARMLKEFALMGWCARPDWTPRPVITVERGKTGYAMHIDKKRKRTLCAFRLFAYRGDLPEIVAERRRTYIEWARAVVAVHRLLRAPGVLVAHALSPALPPLTPWL